MIARTLIRWMAALISVGTVVGGGLYIKESGRLAPGPLSQTTMDGEITGGFVSHAAFEQDCGHCHAPVHCFEEDRCTECHQDVAEQRTAAVGLHGRLPVSRCQTCHTEHKGRDAAITAFAFANVDHMALAQFSLTNHLEDYTGSPLHCDACHSQAEYVDESLDCVTCHMSENPSYMAGHLQSYGHNCIDCHDGLDRMQDFDHNTVYALDGGHFEVPCESCHLDHAYAGTPRNCSACHEDPAVHAGVFGLDCARCHVTAAWTPAQLTQHTFLLDHGADENRACEDCHPNAYSSTSCTACHDHAPEAILDAHASYEILDLANCAACHPTGRSGEGTIAGSQTPKDWSVEPEPEANTFRSPQAGPGSPAEGTSPSPGNGSGND